MKKTLKIAYVDFWPEWKYENFIQPILEEYYDVVIDQKNPDILFHSIFGGAREARKYKCKKILFLGENWRPKQFQTDYSISFDPQSDTNFRLPLWQAFLFLWPEWKAKLFNRVNHTEFKRFAAFTVSNPNNNTRNSAYEKLSSYKKVHSYGKVRTNSLELQRFQPDQKWQESKLNFFHENPHKFMLTYENTSYPNYCTEKIMDSFLAGSIPIYWGDPKIAEDWNPDAFINVKGSGDWMEHVKLMDRNPLIFNDMYSQPVFKDSQKIKVIENMEGLEYWLIGNIDKG